MPQPPVTAIQCICKAYVPASAGIGCCETVMGRLRMHGRHFEKTKAPCHRMKRDTKPFCLSFATPGTSFESDRCKGAVSCARSHSGHILVGSGRCVRLLHGYVFDGCLRSRGAFHILYIL